MPATSAFNIWFFALAVENEIKTIAFPCISTGVYGYPKELACEIAVETVRVFLKEHPEVKKVVFVCFNEMDYALYLNRIIESAG